jgi:hypothetical protein
MSTTAAAASESILKNLDRLIPHLEPCTKTCMHTLSYPCKRREPVRLPRNGSQRRL